MSENLYFTSSESNINVVIGSSCLKQMISYSNISSNFEIGGILIGAYNTELTTAYIKEVTGPPTDSKSGYTWFKRGTHGLRNYLKLLWKQKLYYLGEWHFHPNNSASPSLTDIKQMKEIAKSDQFNCPEPILIILGKPQNEFEFLGFVIINENRTISLTLSNESSINSIISIS